MHECRRREPAGLSERPPRIRVPAADAPPGPPASQDAAGDDQGATRPDTGPPPAAGQSNLNLPARRGAAAPKPYPDPDPRRDTHPDWPAPGCVECQSNASVRKATRASQRGDWECVGKEHPDEIRFFRATDDARAKAAEFRGRLLPGEDTILAGAWEAANVPADDRTWASAHAALAVQLAQELISSRPARTEG